MNLNETVALVAGASGDIGRAISFELLGAGAEVFMLGRSMARLVQVPPPVHVRQKCHFVAADLTDGDAITRVKAEIGLRGRLDILVLSVGTYERSQETTVFASQIGANLIGPYALLQQLLRMLIGAQGQNRIREFEPSTQSYGRNWPIRCDQARDEGMELLWLLSNPG